MYCQHCSGRSVLEVIDHRVILTEKSLNASMTAADNGTVISKGTQSASTFSCFSKLPVELRLHVWRCSTLVPREFRLLDRRGDNCLCSGGQVHFRPYNLQTDIEEEWTCPASKEQKIPATLHTCRESREEVGKVYRYLACGIWAHHIIDEIWSECIGPYDRDYW